MDDITKWRRSFEYRKYNHINKTVKIYINSILRKGTTWEEKTAQTNINIEKIEIETMKTKTSYRWVRSRRKFENIVTYHFRFISLTLFPVSNSCCWDNWLLPPTNRFNEQGDRYFIPLSINLTVDMNLWANHIYYLNLEGTLGEREDIRIIIGFNR